MMPPRKMFAWSLLIVLTSFTMEGYGLFLGGSECTWSHCRDTFQTAFQASPDPCPAITEALSCLVETGCSLVIDFNFIGFKSELEKLYTDYDCKAPEDNNTATDTPSIAPPTDSPVEKCDPKLSILPNNSDSVVIQDLALPIMHPTDSLSNVLCRQHYYPTLRYCSLFSYSHLHSFGADDIQTCSLPGTWYLLKHNDVTIEVTGVSDSIESSLTKLEKVNITLQDTECSRDAIINYVATATDEKLPSTFSSDDYIKVKILDPIDFHVNKDSTITTIHAPWLNLTVVITKYAGYVGVVLRMPTDLIRGADGLCSTSCPAHTVDDTVIDRIKEESCYHDSNSALYACAINADLNNVLEGDVESSLPFIKTCQFSVLRPLSYTALSFMKAVARQHTLLPDVAPDITPEPFDPDILPPIFPALTTTSTGNSILQTVSSFERYTRQTSFTSSKTNQATSTSSHGNTVTLPTNIKDGLGSLPSSSNIVTVNRLLLMLVTIISSAVLLYRSC